MWTVLLVYFNCNSFWFGYQGFGERYLHCSSLESAGKAALEPETSTDLPNWLRRSAQPPTAGTTEHVFL